jgi:hypothetical protein
MAKIEVRFNIHYPSFKRSRKLIEKVRDFLHRIYMSSFWCEFRPHLWNVYANPHWRKCERCDERELDHNDDYYNPDWQPTQYGTPAWDEQSM